MSCTGNRLYKALPARPERSKLTSAHVSHTIYAGLTEWISILLRSLHIHILNFPRLRQSSEPPKAAIQKSRIKALLRSSVHIAPLAVSIFLIQLNWRKQFYVQEHRYISALPYLAKFHEILMQMSIAAIAATWIRAGLLQDSGLQFGALIAMAQTANPVYVVSPEFLGALFRTRSKAWRTVCFAIATILTIALASTVGPSSTVAMLPREGKFYSIDYTYTFDKPEAECFPAELNIQPVDGICTQLYNSSTKEVNNANFYCSPDDSEATNAMQYVVSQNGGRDGEVTTELGGALALRQFKTWIKTLDNYDPFADSGYFVQDGVVQSPFNVTKRKPSGAIIVGTTQQLHVASSLNAKAQTVVNGAFGWSDKNTGGVPISYSVDTKAPYVTTQCFTSYFYNNTNTVNGTITTPYDFDSADRVQFPNFQEDSYGQLDISMVEFQRMSFSSNASQLTWIEPPAQYRLNISILALVQTSATGIVCAVKAAWGSTTMNSTSSVEAWNKSVRRDLAQASSIPESWKNHTTWPTEIVLIAPQFLNSAFPLRDTTNTTRKEVSDLIDSTVGGSMLPEILMIGITAGAMSRLTHNVRELTDVPSLLAPAALPGSYNITINSYYAGKGWLIEELPDRLAIAILSVFCIFAVLHICYHIITGISSNSWDSISEIIALAMNSRSPESLKNASAGISTFKTFAQPVGIRVRNFERLEMVFLRDENGADDIGKVDLDQKY